MIQSKRDFFDYLEADRVANHISPNKNNWIACRIEGRYNYLYLMYMRRVEYVMNCKNSIISKIYLKLLNMRLKRLSVLTGITIPPNTFGKGLYIPHWGSIVVNSTARFGDNCVLQSGVNISEGVVGGNHIYIAAGAKLLMNVHIANDIIVAANAVVTKDFERENIVIGGIPASVISENGFRNRTQV